MFVRLTRAGRLGAGRLLALVYLLCVMAPGLSFAFNDEPRAAHNDLGMVHLHHDEPVQHVHNDGHVHGHSVGAQSLLGQMGSESDLKPAAMSETSAPDKASQAPLDAKCCGLVCLSALPASVIDIVKPAAPTSVCSIENYRNVADNAPPRLYRPPIS